MDFPVGSLSSRILDCLNIQDPERCKELSMLFERCNLRELQIIFPNVVQTIFGQNENKRNGWGLRILTRERTAPLYFEALLNFFAPMGPMLKLCYRLCQESMKFEVDLKVLPHRVLQMLHYGEFSMYYSDLLQVDPFSRTISALTLNPFDYYMLHFAIHGTVPLHTAYCLAQDIHTEGLKSVYYMLVAEYLTTFLPTNVADNKLSPDVFLNPKIPQPLPLPTFKFQRLPKYIKTVSGNLFLENRSSFLSSNNQILHPLTLESNIGRNNSWRTETVLHLFVDIWLCSDIENVRHLPSPEFIRAVRLLVKQIHAFVFTAALDDTAMLNARYLAHPMLRDRIFPFLRCAISLWPLDSSMSMILELWYSYIQPWRYSRFKNLDRQRPEDVTADRRFDTFIAENMHIYTQIFVQVLPRFQRLDYTLLQNCIMLHRLTKVFCESVPIPLLQMIEERYLRIAHDRSYNSAVEKKYNDSKLSFDSETPYPRDLYVPMFGESTKLEIQQFTFMIQTTRLYINKEVIQLTERKCVDQPLRIFSSIVPLLKSTTSVPQEDLDGLVQISDILQSIIYSFSNVFEVDVLTTCKEIRMYHRYDENSANKDNKLKKENKDMYCARLLYLQMNEVQQLWDTCGIDPALLPIQLHEFKHLVRFLHQFSCKINDMIF